MRYQLPVNNPSAPSNISTVPVPKLDTWIPSVNLSILFQICFRAFSLLQECFGFQPEINPFLKLVGAMQHVIYVQN